MKFCRRLFALMLAISPLTSNAELITYNFSGEINSNWGWNLPGNAPATGTSFSGSITYESVVSGSQSQFANTYQYLNAISSIIFSVGSYSFSGTGGNIYVYSTPTYGAIDFETWASFGNQFSNIESQVPGFHLNALDLALRRSGQALPDGLALPTDLSHFSTTITESHADYDLISNQGSNVARLVGSGPLNSIAAVVPEPASVMLLAIGLAGLGFSRRKKQKLAA